MKRYQIDFRSIFFPAILMSLFLVIYVGDIFAQPKLSFESCDDFPGISREVESSFPKNFQCLRDNLYKSGNLYENLLEFELGKQINIKCKKGGSTEHSIKLGEAHPANSIIELYPSNVNDESKSIEAIAFHEFVHLLGYSHALTLPRLASNELISLNNPDYAYVCEACCTSKIEKDKKRACKLCQSPPITTLNSSYIREVYSLESEMSTLKDYIHGYLRRWTDKKSKKQTYELLTQLANEDLDIFHEFLIDRYLYNRGDQFGSIRSPYEYPLYAGYDQEVLDRMLSKPKKFLDILLMLFQDPSLSPSSMINKNLYQEDKKLSNDIEKKIENKLNNANFREALFEELEKSKEKDIYLSTIVGAAHFFNFPDEAVGIVSEYLDKNGDELEEYFRPSRFNKVIIYDNQRAVVNFVLNNEKLFSSELRRKILKSHAEYKPYGLKGHSDSYSRILLEMLNSDSMFRRSDERDRIINILEEKGAKVNNGYFYAESIKSQLQRQAFIDAGKQDVEFDWSIYERAFLNEIYFYSPLLLKTSMRLIENHRHSDIPQKVAEQMIGLAAREFGPDEISELAYAKTFVAYAFMVDPSSIKKIPSSKAAIKNFLKYLKSCKCPELKKLVPLGTRLKMMAFALTSPQDNTWIESLKHYDDILPVEPSSFNLEDETLTPRYRKSLNKVKSSSQVPTLYPTLEPVQIKGHRR